MGLGEVIVSCDDGTGFVVGSSVSLVTLECRGSAAMLALFEFTPAEARLVAKAMVELADEIEAREGRDGE